MTEPLLGPVALAGAASFAFGASQVTAKRGLAHVDARLGALVSIGTGAVLYGVTLPLWAVADQWLGPGFWVFVLNGLIHPMLSMYLAFEATARTGPTVAATFSATTPIFAAATAVAFLGESVSVAVAAGTLATAAGIATLSWTPGGLRGVVRAALLFATGAAVIRGLNQTVGKFGLTLTPNVFMAAFVSYVVSTAGWCLLFRLSGRRLSAPAAPSGLAWFALTGSITSVAIGCMYAALSAGSVVVVAPIVAAYPLFALLVSVAVGDERLTRRLGAGVVLVVSGVAMVSAGR